MSSIVMRTFAQDCGKVATTLSNSALYRKDPTMKTRTALALVLLTIAAVCSVGRGETPFIAPFSWCRGCARVPSCCPNDYVAKPLPDVVRAPCGCGDDYCRKTLPNVVRAPNGCGDDYCPKKGPVSLPLNKLGWQCGPPDCACQGR
jgi:hypothetical protein